MKPTSSEICSENTCKYTCPLAESCENDYEACLSCKSDLEEANHFILNFCSRTTLLVSIVISMCINITIISVIVYCLLKPYPPKNEGYSAVLELKDSLYLPCEKDSTKYCSQESQSFANLFTLLLSEYEGRPNRSTYEEEKDENRPVLKQRFSEMYFVNKPNSTGERLSLHAAKYSYNRQIDKKHIEVPANGSYIVFVSIEHCFRSSGNTLKRVTANVVRNFQGIKSIIYQQSIKPLKGEGFLAYVPVKGFFPIRLQQYDKLSLEMQETGSLYSMKVGNVFGLQEVVKDNLGWR